MIRFTVQISDQLNIWLEEQAQLNHRSKNKQVEYILDRAMRGHPIWPTITVNKAVIVDKEKS